MNKIHFIRCQDYKQVHVDRALSRLTDDYFSSNDFTGQHVLLKPNLLIPEAVENAVTTHPSIILWFARKLKSLGAKPCVGDSPAVGTARAVIEKMGLSKPLAELDVPLVEFTGEVEVCGDTGTAYHRLRLAQEVVHAGKIINLARIKTHGQMGLTLATKNLFGSVVGMKKAAWHLQAGKDLLRFSDLLLSVAQLVNADFHLVDGIIAMEGNGPRSGTPRPLTILAAGHNPYILDAFIAHLLGYQNHEIPMLSRAREIGLLPTGNPIVIGDDPGAFKVANWQRARPADPGFTLPNWLRPLLERQLTPAPIVKQVLCDGCGVCHRACPADAIEKGQPARIISRNCIHCFCCQELCPRGAITVRDPLVARLLRALKRPKKQ